MQNRRPRLLAHPTSYGVGGEMLLNGPRPIGWSRVTCTPLDIHSPLATGPRIICTRMPRLCATTTAVVVVAAVVDMTGPFSTIVAEVDEHLNTPRNTVRRIRERERESRGTAFNDASPGRPQIARSTL